LVYNAGFRGSNTVGNSNFQWGGQIQAEQIKDKLNEWHYIDSLGFAKPSLVDGNIVMNEYITSRNTLNSYRVSGYVQNSQLLNKVNNMRFNYGVRTNWWSYNTENVVSPRMQFSFEPNRRHNRAILLGDTTGTLKKDMVLKAAVGFYYQPTFFTVSSVILKGSLIPISKHSVLFTTFWEVISTLNGRTGRSNFLQKLTTSSWTTSFLMK
jgi:hypothetical protein